MTEIEKKTGIRYKKGTVLLTEKPFVFVLKSELHSERCDYCFSRGQLLKCQGCNFACYCDRECQKKGWIFHKKECPNLFKFWPRVIPDTKGGAEERSFYTKAQSRSFKDLMSHYTEIKNDSTKMEHFIAVVEVLKDYLGNDSLPNTAELLGIYGRLVINSFNILDEELQSIGVGIYLAASVFDHACSSNAVATFEGTTISIRTIKDLRSKNFSDIYISYNDMLNLPSKRQEELKKNYYFLCQCEKCTSLEELKDMTSLVCQNEGCRNAIPGGLIETVPTCSKCRFEVSREKMEEINEVIDFTVKQLESMKDVAYLDICRMCLNKHENLLHPMNIYSVKVMELAFEACIALKNWADALTYGLKVKEYLRRYYGNCHPLFGMFLMKLGKIGLLENYEESANLILEAANIFMVTHGSGHSLMRNSIRPLLCNSSS